MNTPVTVEQTKVSHTPGPLETLRDVSRDSICMRGFSEPFRWQIIRAIEKGEADKAAAPELVEALRTLRKALQWEHTDERLDHDQMMIIVDRALAKAGC